MDGAAYLSHFYPVDVRDVTDARIGFDIILSKLYEDGQIADLLDADPPDVFTDVEAVRDDMRRTARIRQQNARFGAISQEMGFDVGAVIHAADVTPELSEKVQRSHDNFTAALQQRSAAVLVGSMLGYRRKPQKGPAEAIRQAVLADRHNLVRDLGRFVGEMSIRRILMGNGKQVDAADIVANYQVEKRLVPGWLRETIDMDNPIRRVVASILGEGDAFLALTDLVLTHQLDYVPVFASPRTEKLHISHEEKGWREWHWNPNADLLLVSLVDNDIRPYQVKQEVSDNERSKYIEGMDFISPQLLGQTESMPTTYKSRVGFHTGFAAVSHYGRITSAWHQVHGAKPGRKPSTADRNRYAALTAPAVESLLSQFRARSGSAG